MAKPRRRRTFRELRRKLTPVAASPAPFSVDLTDSARTVYLELRESSLRAEQRGDPTNQHCTTFRMVDDAIRRLIPADPTNQKYALHEPLDQLYRIAKGRLRIVWMVDVDHRAILIVFISNTLRKEGDAHDPYKVLNAVARAGYLNKILDDWRKAMEVPPDAPID